jgi:hypothetical protein
MHPLDAHRGHNGLDPPGIPALGKVGHALDYESDHNPFRNNNFACSSESLFELFTGSLCGFSTIVLQWEKFRRAAQFLGVRELPGGYFQKV